MEKKLTDTRGSIFFDSKTLIGKSEKKLNEYNTKISDFVSKLDENISLIIKGHEHDFLSAYKTIMNQIQIQMSRLRQNSDDQTVMVKNDKAVINLQETLAWYQNEAVKLSDACSRLQSRYDKVKEKIQTFTIQNSYLEQQIKMLIRQNQTLKSNLNEEQKVGNQSLNKNNEKQGFPGTIDNFRKKFGIKNENLLKSLENFMNENESSSNRQLKQLDKEIADIKDQIRKISAGQSDIFLKRNEYEELFLECVDEMRKEIIRKKAKTYSIKRSGIGRQENLVISEREKLIESFVTNEDIISTLYDKLFPWKNDKFGADVNYSFNCSAVAKNPDQSLKKSQNSLVGSVSGKQAIVVKGKLLING